MRTLSIAPFQQNQTKKVIWSACTVNCGSRCPLRMHVVDGEMKYVRNGQYRR
ncbi:hypothetical protein ACLB1Q_10415 [Escherichia coli]